MNWINIGMKLLLDLLFMSQDIFREVGIEFTTSDDYDYAWAVQANIIDKKKPLQESIYKGIEFVSKIT